MTAISTLAPIKGRPIPKQNMRVCCYRITRAQRAVIDALVNEGQFFSYSEAVRYIARSFIDHDRRSITAGFNYVIPPATTGNEYSNSEYVRVSSKFPAGLLADVDSAAALMKRARRNRSAFMRRAVDWYIDQLESWKELKK